MEHKGSHSHNFCSEEKQSIDPQDVVSLNRNLDLVSNISGEPAESGIHFLDPFQILDLFCRVSDDYQYLIFDTHTGLNELNLVLLQECHQTIFISSTDPESVIDTYTLIKASQPYLNESDIYLIINQFVEKRISEEAHQDLDFALQHFIGYKIPLLGAIPVDDLIKFSPAEEVFPGEKTRQSEALTEIDRIAMIIHGEGSRESENRMY
jgi:flagellar biosynthesis protein FlhG